MSEQREVVILSGVRTAIGDYGGSLKDIPPTELAARVVREAVSRAKVDPNDIGQCVFGNVLHGEPKDMYLSRVACVNGGLPHGTGALTLNRLCGSGLQAIVSASQYILLGDTDAAVAGGAGSMSRRGHEHDAARWGARIGDLARWWSALTDPFDATIHMHHRRARRRQVRHLARAAGHLCSLSHKRAPRRLPAHMKPDPADRLKSRSRHNSIPTTLR
jgi:acetyl-CoA C-acetyltransferase